MVEALNAVMTEAKQLFDLGQSLQADTQSTGPILIQLISVPATFTNLSP